MTTRRANRSRASGISCCFSTARTVLPVSQVSSPAAPSSPARIFRATRWGYAKTVLEQVVAANFDTVFILSSLNQDFSQNRIMRYLTQARQSGAAPVVVLTKADLATDVEQPIAEVLSVAPDVPVHAVSSVTGFGLDTLAPYLAPAETVVFLGMSGVGKSSLLNTLMKREVMEVKEIREDDSRGRHTTTHRQLFMLPSGAMVIDTPGMRELGLFEAEDGNQRGVCRRGRAVHALPVQQLQTPDRTRLRGNSRAKRRIASPRTLGALPRPAAGKPLREQQSGLPRKQTGMGKIHRQMEQGNAKERGKRLTPFLCIPS